MIEEIEMIISFTKKITLGPNGTILTVQAIPPQGQDPDNKTAYELGTFDNITYLYIPENSNYTLEAQVPYEIVSDLDTFIENHPEFSDLNTPEEQSAALAALKTKLINEVKAISYRFDNELEVEEMFFTSSLGFPCDGDRKSTQNIQGILSGFDITAKLNSSITGREDVIIFRDRNNDDHFLTKAEVEILNAEIGANGSALYAQKWLQLKTISEGTKELLKNFKVIFNMSDFSN